MYQTKGVKGEDQIYNKEIIVIAQDYKANIVLSLFDF